MKSKEVGQEQSELSEEIIYKIDIPANRLLSFFFLSLSKNQKGTSNFIE